MKVLLVAINSKYIHSNLAVHSLAAYAAKEGYRVQLGEYTINQTFSEILSGIYEEKPDVVAFSTYIWNVELVTKLARELKKLLKNCRFWAGGPQAGYNAIGMLKDNEAFECIINGEGEKTFASLVKAAAQGDAYDGIEGITYRKGRDIIVNPARELMDMDELCFVYENLDDFKNKIIYYESSRGCPYGCSYCLSSVEKGVRFRSLELVFKELKHFLDAGVAQVKFVDRTFNCNHARTKAILEYIRDNDNGVTNFHFEISADLLTDEEIQIVSQLRPGLVQMEIGVQTTNPDTIRAINRTMNLDRLKANVADLNATRNVHLHLDLIAGLPMENLASFRQSFNDVYAMEPEQLQLGFLKVLDGSPMAAGASEYELEYLDFPPFEVLSNRWISYGELLQLKRIEELVETYYNSGQYLYTIRYLAEYFDTPYDMYDGFARYCDACGHYLVRHSREAVYRILRDFALTVTGMDVELFDNLLCLDLNMRESIKSRPYFLEDYSEEEKSYMRQLYRNNNIPKVNHMEKIDIRALEWAGITDDTHEVEGYVVFDYRKRNPLTYQAEITICE